MSFYISAIRIGENELGTEFVSYARVHTSVSGIIKRQGTVYSKKLILEMMQRSLFYTVVWDRKQKKWLLGSLVTVYTDENDENYIVTNADDETDLYRLKTC